MPTAAKDAKTETASGHPTAAQLAKLTELAEAKGIEAPTPATAEEATSLIEQLQAEAPEPDAEPEPESQPDEEEEEAEAEEQPEPTGGKRTDKQTQAMFGRAVNAFRSKLADVFQVDAAEITPAPHAGVIGFLLPGYSEPKAHPDFAQCQTCNGRGKILTGAVTGDESKDWHVCPDGRCKGNGFWQRLHQPPPPAPPAAPAAITGPTVYENTSNGHDEWGEAPAWMGDPRIGAGQ